VTGRIGIRLISPTRVTSIALLVSIAVIVFSAAFLLTRYPSLPSVLPVHFRPDGRPNGWQYKNYPRVLMPVLVQVALALTLGAVGALLLSRPRGAHDDEAADVKAASAAAEGVALMTSIWIAFQGYAAVALVRMWERERAGLGAWYTYLELAGVVLTAIIAVRTNLRLGRPVARPFVAEHWRLGRLYRNPADPALFVPTRDGARWTLNFGRPVAAALMGLILAIGIVAPTVILGLLLR
jgi:uncharacterized membrane protein